ncbi:MAG: ATP-binding protein [Pseudomonadales bacterium]
MDSFDSAAAADVALAPGYQTALGIYLSGFRCGDAALDQPPNDLPPLDAGWPDLLSAAGHAFRSGCAVLLTQGEGWEDWADTLRRQLGPERYRELVRFLGRIRMERFLADVDPQAAVPAVETAASPARPGTVDGYYRAAFDNAAVGLAQLDTYGRWLLFNDAICSITGYSREQLERLTFEDITHPDDLAADWAQARRLLAGEIDDYTMEKRYLRPDGSVVWVNLSGALIRDADGAPARFISVIEDRTAHKQAEREREALVERLAESDRRKDAFLAALAHELRNPLAPVRNGLEILKLTAADERSQRITSMMDRQMTHLIRLVDDLLDFSRISRGVVKLRKQRVLLHDAVTTAIEAMAGAIEAKQLKLTVESVAATFAVHGDAERIVQVLVNLLSNAVKYTGEGGHVGLSVARHGDRVELRVTDTGIGIPADALHEIFEMFSQVGPRLHGEQGLGIGLALVQQLVSLHGGTVQARSQGVGYGSEFIVRLPLDEAAEGVPPVAPMSDSGADSGAEAPARRPRILVADDNRDAAATLVMMLELSGYHDVHMAHDGVEAVEAVVRLRPSIVLLDIGMPRLNGHEAALRIRALPGGEALLLVALTGWGQEEDKQRSWRSGFDLHVTKPVDAQALLELLANLRPPRQTQPGNDLSRVAAPAIVGPAGSPSGAS